MPAEKRLGRGLGSLLPSKTDGESQPNMVDVSQIYPNRFQPRRHFDEEALAELRESIRTHGILQPVALRRDGDRFELIAGERRWRAAQEAGMTRIPAVIRDTVSDDAMLELALVENVQREDLDPIERALGFRRMMTELDMTQSAVAERVGLKRATIANHIRLLDLADPIQRLVARGALSMGHARALLGLADEAERSRLADLVIAQGLSVREVESRVRRLNGVDEPLTAEEDLPRGDGPSNPSSRDATEEAGRLPWVKAVEERLRRTLGTRAQVRVHGGGSGQVLIDFNDEAELDRILTLIAPAEQL